MKTYYLKIFITLCMFTFLWVYQDLYSQNTIIGNWEGTFMNDFKVLVHFNANHENQYKGNIKMFSSDNMIQDDELDNIHQNDNLLTFYISAKETTFEGSFNEGMSKLAGNFVFPDGSKHPIQLSKRVESKPSRLEYQKLKNQLYTVEELNNDLAFLYSKLQEYHPQLYLFTSKDSLYRLSENLRSQIHTSLTLEEFFTLSSTLTDAVHCSHTGIRLPGHYQKLVHQFGNYFPCRIFFKEDKAFYISGCEEITNTVTPGHEIISINNLSIFEITEQVFHGIPAEGCNSTTKYNMLNRKFIEYFYFKSDSAKFNVKFKNADSFQSISIPSSSLEDVNRKLGWKESNRKVEFKMIENINAGLLKVPTFAVQDMDEYFQMLDSVFRVLRENQTKSLILDLRDNEGGHPIFAAQLLSYLTAKDFTYFKRNTDVQDFEPLYNIIQANELNFQGNIYVLVNGGCLSTSGHLISLVKFHTKAVFVGEAPGSSFRCNDFSIPLILPITGLELNIPRTTFETAVAGFQICEPFPIDFEITPSVSDIINGEDTLLNHLKSMINNK